MGKITNLASYYFEKFKYLSNIRALKIKTAKKYILVRLDDFPHRIEKMNKLVKIDKIFKKYKIPYILGVTPNISLEPLNPNCNKTRVLSKEEITFLKKGVKENRITIAMHGLTHKTISTKEYSEYIGKSNKIIEKEIKKGLNLFKKYSLPKPKIFMPPYNSFNKENLQIFKKYFKITTGGPETIKEFGKVKNISEIKYIPSYYPNYLTKKNINTFYPKPGLNCITIHWAWFNEKEIEELCKIIKPYIIDYVKYIKNNKEK